jgi:hypothetical protein
MEKISIFFTTYATPTCCGSFLHDPLHMPFFGRDFCLHADSRGALNQDVGKNPIKRD